jgi:dihydrofolate synthase/folylpolyglutamate synthase
MIEKSYLVNYWKNIKKQVNHLKATFFDTTTALAFDYFANSKVDVAVIETGLGGRLDSTNIVKPVSAVITPIAIDHIKQLGKDLRSIAKEKVVIVKKGSTFFSAKQKNEVQQIFEDAAPRAKSYFPISKSIKILHKEIHLTYSQFDLVDRLRNEKFKRVNLNLAGDFQMENSALAYLVARWYLEKVGISFSEIKFRETLEKLTWPGRLQTISEKPGIFLDVSHNYAGFKASVKFLSEMGEIGDRKLLIGLLDDKEYKQIVRLLSRYFEKVIVTQPAHDRAIAVSVLSKEFLRYGIQAELEQRIIPAYQRALQNLKKNEQLYVMGSHFLIGEILKVIKKKDLTQ